MQKKTEIILNKLIIVAALIFFILPHWESYYLEIILSVLLVSSIYVYLKLIPEAAKHINQDGYVVLNKHNDLEHRYIAKQILKRELAKNEIIHHIDGNKINNHIHNLCLMDREKHELFHSWLSWKRRKSGKYPSFKDQHRILEEEFGGVLLDKITSNKTQIVVAVEESLSLNTYGNAKKEVVTYLVRKNRTTNNIFIEFEGEYLINPDGKEIELDEERFIGPIEVTEAELTQKQIEVYQNKINARIHNFNREKNISKLQNLLYEELRKERRQIAIETKKQLYEIFNNNTLTEMAELMPTTEADMLQVFGIGSIKYQMYGRRFLIVIERFRKKYNLQSPA